ncbi:hypothetical protein [Peribacillus sp. TH16]|uniref:hypothetical protein n=1 Tax=Peribacillus sp. TH16 TaxID=2798482 RepID=UPI00406C9D76
MKASYFYVKRPAKKKTSCIYRDFLFFYHERSGASALLGFVIMFQSYYYITLFVSFFLHSYEPRQFVPTESAYL